MFRRINAWKTSRDRRLPELDLHLDPNWWRQQLRHLFLHFFISYHSYFIYFNLNFFVCTDQNNKRGKIICTRSQGLSLKHAVKETESFQNNFLCKYKFKKYLFNINIELIKNTAIHCIILYKFIDQIKMIIL